MTVSEKFRFQKQISCTMICHSLKWRRGEGCAAHSWVNSSTFCDNTVTVSVLWRAQFFTSLPLQIYVVWNPPFYHPIAIAIANVIIVTIAIQSLLVLKTLSFQAKCGTSCLSCNAIAISDLFMFASLPKRQWWWKFWWWWRCWWCSWSIQICTRAKINCPNICILKK